MTRNNSLTAIGFVVVTFISLTLQTTAAQAAREVCCCGATKWDGRKCWWEPHPGECPGVESGRQKWDAGIGKCIDTGSGGVGEGSTDCGPGYSYDPERGCRKIKRIGKKKVMPPAEQAPEQAQPNSSENPCGKGWYKAADGQCYPKLN